MSTWEHGAREARNACVVRDYTHGAMTMAEVGRAYGITKQRVSQIIKAERIRAQRERCARGEHGDVVRQSYESWENGRMVIKRGSFCNDCDTRIEP